MKYVCTFIVCIILISVSSCRKDFSTIPSFGLLQFSKETIYLDTIFTNIGSSTYSLKVYNRADKSITIPEIKLENGINSNYRLNVDGITGKEFNDIDILANDSIFIFIETTIDLSNIPNPLYTDKILFDNGNNQQKVDLVTLVQDANFIFPERDEISLKIDSLTLDGQPTNIKGKFLTDADFSTAFKKNKPTIIYGYAAIPANKTLTIEAGAKIYFHDNSGLIVDDGATLKVNGTIQEKVIFEGDRLEHSFSETPGQWGVILIRPGSINNEINHAVIKNGLVGVLMGDLLGSDKQTSLIVQNSEIYNHAAYGIWARGSILQANNVVVGSAGIASFAATMGGFYDFIHSSFANYWNRGIRQLPTVLVNNFQDSEDENGEEIRFVSDLVAANFTNCIFDGNNNVELLLDKVDGSLFNYKISNSLIKFNPTDDILRNIPEMDFTNTTFYQDNLLNGNPDFRNPQKNDFIIRKNSDGINKAKRTLFTIDLLGFDRRFSPDIGAYQHIVSE